MPESVKPLTVSSLTVYGPFRTLWQASVFAVVFAVPLPPLSLSARPAPLPSLYVPLGDVSPWQYGLLLVVTVPVGFGMLESNPNAWLTPRGPVCLWMMIR